MLTLKEKVWWFALYSRIFVLTTSAIFNFIIPDHSADAFISPQNLKDTSESCGDVIVRHLFGGLVRWDAQYFMHIASYGYTYENCLAFFPLFPMAIRIFAGLLSHFLLGLMSQYSIYILSAVVVNVVCFIKSATILHELSLRVLKDARLSYTAAILYCINPASIFFTAPYSETLFACLSFHGMLACANGFSVSCGIPFGLAATARSNGVLGIGFIAHEKLKHIINHTVPHLVKESCGWNIKSVLMAPMIVAVITITLVPSALATVLALIPFIGFQAYGYHKFCVPHNHNLPVFLVTYAETHGLTLPGSNISVFNFNAEKHWCNAVLPLSYSFVQHHYWDVGFLRYYQWKQIPNFLLATPVIWIILTYAYKFIKWNPQVCLMLGILDSPLNSKTSKSKVKKSYRSYLNESDILFSSETFVYVVHAVSLTVFSIFFINIQVTTRLISSASPVLYWFTASMFTSAEPMKSPSVLQNISSRLTKIARKDSINQNIEVLENMYSQWKVFLITQIPSRQDAKLIQCYFLSYLLLGTAMFSNFYPWT